MMAKNIRKKKKQARTHGSNYNSKWLWVIAVVIASLAFLTGFVLGFSIALDEMLEKASRFIEIDKAKIWEMYYKYSGQT